MRVRMGWGVRGLPTHVTKGIGNKCKENRILKAILKQTKM